MILVSKTTSIIIYILSYMKLAYQAQKNSEKINKAGQACSERNSHRLGKRTNIISSVCFCLPCGIRSPFLLGG